MLALENLAGPDLGCANAVPRGEHGFGSRFHVAEKLRDQPKSWPRLVQLFLAQLSACDHAVESIREEQAFRRAHRAVDDVQHLSCRTIVGDRVIAWRIVRREAAEQRSIETIAAVNDRRGGRRADTLVIDIRSACGAVERGAQVGDRCGLALQSIDKENCSNQARVIGFNRENAGRFIEIGLVGDQRRCAVIGGDADVLENVTGQEELGIISKTSKS